MVTLEFRDTTRTPKIVALNDGCNGAQSTVITEISPRCLQGAQGNIILIEGHAFLRECLLRSLRSSAKQDVFSFSNVAEWLDASERIQASLIVLCVLRLSEEAAKRELGLLWPNAVNVPIVVLAEKDDLTAALDAFAGGAKGYIPTSIGFDIAMEAMHFVSVGGTYVPTECVIAAKLSTAQAQPNALNGTFTNRELSVIAAIRKGKSNKIIAYDLNMCESTVKVHVRRIMKKLRAKNRTEVAIRAADISPLPL